MATVNNPVTVMVTDSSAVTQGVTSFKILVGMATGGPYTTASASVALSAMSLNGTVYSAPFASLAFSPALSNFTTYFAVAEAENSSGASGGSPEVSFQLVSVPTPPTNFQLV